MAVDNEAEFTISVVGDKTKEKWYGKFKVVKRLSFRQQMMRDRLRREYLGGLAEYATPRILEQAVIFSDLAVGLIEFPDFWKNSNNGQDLHDDNLLEAIWNEVAKVWGLLKDEDKKKTAEDATELKKAVAAKDAEKEDSEAGA